MNDLVRLLKGGDGMIWKRFSERRWVTDCGCRVVWDASSKLWIARNSHGSRISMERSTTLESAKACVEQYIAARRDAGLFPYNR